MENRPPQEPGPAPLEGALPAGATSSPHVQGGPPRTVPPQQPGAPGNKGTNSLVLAILAPASMLLTGPLAVFAMLMTYPDEGPSPKPWVTPMVLFSLPLLFAVLSLRLALPVLKSSPRPSKDRSAAAVALCIAGLMFALALGPALDAIGLFG